MIISQTPLRLSFFGGGTDFEGYYRKHTGVVLSATINKYIYIIVKSRYDGNIVLNYSERERVSDVNQIKHPIFREALKLTSISAGIEITSIADIPSEGSGLGSSSSFTVGLLNALFAYKGEYKNQYELAEMACEIEIERLKEPIGKQDQYAAAFGGFKKYTFNKSGTVSVKNLLVSNNDCHTLNMCSILFYTGIARKASTVLKEQETNIAKNTKTLNNLKEMALRAEKDFTNLDIQKLGTLLDDGWKEKQKLASQISNTQIEILYNLAKQAGVFGGKLLGAGGGGYFFFLCPPEYQHRLRTALQTYRELPVAFERYGSRIILSITDQCRFADHLIIMDKYDNLANAVNFGSTFSL